MTREGKIKYEAQFKSYKPEQYNLMKRLCVTRESMRTYDPNGKRKAWKERKEKSRDELCLHLNFALGKYWQFCLNAFISLHSALCVFKNIKTLAFLVFQDIEWTTHPYIIIWLWRYLGELLIQMRDGITAIGEEEMRMPIGSRSLFSPVVQRHKCECLLLWSKL